MDVVGRRPDGFHDLETLFVSLPWGDSVEITRTEGVDIRLDLECEDPSVPTDASNLAVRAANLYRDAARRCGRPFAGGLDIRLVKRIPSGAGLGGGSSDAAAVLRLLDREFGALDVGELHALAARLGSDVPFFLLDAAVAVGRGRGEVLDPVPIPPPSRLTLILPGTHHDTARVFRGVSPGEIVPPTGGVAAVCDALARGDVPALRETCWNALVPAVLRAFPAYGELIDAVASRLGRRPHVTGTGSALYDLPGIGEVEDAAQRLADLPVEVVSLSHER